MLATIIGILIIAIIVEYLYKYYRDQQAVKIDWDYYNKLMNQIAIWKQPGEHHLLFEIERISIVYDGGKTAIMLYFDTYRDEKMKNYLTNNSKWLNGTVLGEEAEKFLRMFSNVSSGCWQSPPFGTGLNPRNITSVKGKIKKYNQEHFPIVEIHA